MTKKKTFLILSVLFSVVFKVQCLYAQDEVCAGGYPRNDRELILGFETASDLHFDWMASIAERAASSYTDDESLEALYSEFELARSYLDSVRQYPNEKLSQRGNEFIAAVLNTDFLEIPSLYQTGTHGQEALFQVRETLNSVNAARGRLQLCLHASSDRLTIVDSARDRICGGGYSIQDFTTILSRFVKAIRYLIKIEEIGKLVSEGVFSTNQAKAHDYDLKYYIEEIELVGTTAAPRVSAQTQRFIRTVFDPFYLGVRSLTVNAPSELLRQQLGQIVVSTVTRAVSLLSSCVDTSVPKKK